LTRVFSAGLHRKAVICAVPAELAGPNLKTLAEPVLNAEMNLFSR